jgi:hypothetical protein
MDATPDDRLYATVLRMVIWDEPEQTVMEVIEKNGFAGAAGRKIYQRARNERIATIRAGCIRKAWSGLLWTGLGLVLFTVFWFGFGWITERIYVIAGVFVLIGLWKGLDGLLGVLLAPGKKGSLAE